MTVQPGSARWKELVQQGIIKDAQRNWWLGDAALEIAPMGQNGVNSGALANLQRYADEIGVDYGSLRIYRDVAANWPAPNRVGATCWKVHQQLQARKELIRPGMTVTQAATALGHQNIGRTGPRADVTSKAAAAKEYLADPEVADEVMRNPGARTNIVQAQTRQQERSRSLQDQVNWQKDQHAPPPPMGQGASYDVRADILEDLNEIRYRLRNIHDLQGDLHGLYREPVADSLVLVGNQAHLIAELVRKPESATVTDKALQDLLDGGN